MPNRKPAEFQIARLCIKKGDILAVKVHSPVPPDIRTAMLSSLREILDKAGHADTQTIYVDHDIDIGILLFERRAADKDGARPKTPQTSRAG